MNSLKSLVLVFVVAWAATGSPGAAFAKSNARVLPHKPISQMTLDQVIVFQRVSLKRHEHVVRTFLAWRKHHRNLANAYNEMDVPRCKALGIRAPANVCWSAAAQKWTRSELDESLARKKAREAQAQLAALGDGAEFGCIHRYEGAWNSETGNGYHGGLQMDSTFESDYGPEFVAKWGHAGNWPVWAQVTAARRARDGWYNPVLRRHFSARGYYPWPNTARVCGML